MDNLLLVTGVALAISLTGLLIYHYTARKEKKSDRGGDSQRTPQGPGNPMM